MQCIDLLLGFSLQLSVLLTCPVTTPFQVSADSVNCYHIKLRYNCLLLIHLLQDLLPLPYTATISEETNRWVGEAVVPYSYFPAGVDKFNAFAIHGSDPNRVYEALYPQQEPITQPDL